MIKQSNKKYNDYHVLYLVHLVWSSGFDFEVILPRGNFSPRVSDEVMRLDEATADLREVRKGAGQTAGMSIVCGENSMDTRGWSRSRHSWTGGGL